jgi:hypothetical protein
VVYCDFEVVVAFSAIVGLNSKALILEFSNGFVGFSAATWTMNHKTSIREFGI